MTLEQNLDCLKERIHSVTSVLQKTERPLLVAVSKGHPSSHIMAAYQLGLRDFAESYMQEYLKKQQELKSLTDLRWHFIGHLQTNKVKYLDASCFLLHSLDRLSLAKALNQQMKLCNKTLSILLQLKIDPNDTHKSGLSYAEAPYFVEAFRQLPFLKWVGFMGMGPYGATSQHLAQLYQEFYQQCSTLWKLSSTPTVTPIISLGMSDDLEIALQAGSNLLRIGTALFGARS